MRINEERARSTIALEKFLEEVIKNPTSYSDNTELLYSLKSQNRLAKYSNSQEHISSCSLNTLKSSSNKILDGGFSSLDQLRLGAIEAINESIESKSKPRGKTKTGLKNTIKYQKKKISILEQQNTILVWLLAQLTNNAFKYAANSDETTRLLCAKETNELLAKFSIIENEKIISEIFNNNAQT